MGQGAASTPKPLPGARFSRAKRLRSAPQPENTQVTASCERACLKSAVPG